MKVVLCKAVSFWGPAVIMNLGLLATLLSLGSLCLCHGVDNTGLVPQLTRGRSRPRLLLMFIK